MNMKFIFYLMYTLYINLGIYINMMCHIFSVPDEAPTCNFFFMATKKKICTIRIQ